MIVRLNKGYETNSEFLNTDWYNEGNYVVDETTEEGKRLSEKIKHHSPFFDFVLEEGVLVDIVPTEKPPEPPPEPSLEEQLAEKDRQIQLLQAQNQANADRADFHEELIAEMAMIVYP